MRLLGVRNFLKLLIIFVDLSILIEKLKKLAAIILLILLLFNLVGYRFLFSYVQAISDTHFQTTLNERKYKDEDLICIKAPLSLPYQNDWTQFERVDGEIEIEGKIYKFVKRKVVNGEVVLMCLPDQKRMRIETAKESFFQLASNLSFDNHSTKNSISVYSGKFQVQPVVQDKAIVYEPFFPAQLFTYYTDRDYLLSYYKLQPPTPPPDSLFV